MNKNIIITILLIVVLCLGGYLVFDKVIDKKDNNIKSDNKVQENINEENSTKEDENYDLEEAKKLMEIYVTPYTANKIFDGLSSTLKLKIAYKSLNYDTFPEKISYDEMNKAYKKLFGNGEVSKQYFVPTAFPCDSYYYDSAQNSYIYKKSDGCGGAIWNTNYYIKSATVKDSSLNIVVYYYLTDPDGSNLYLYNDDNSYGDNLNKYKITSLNVNETTDKLQLTNEAFEKYKDKMDTFTFRFEKYNDNYVLKDVFKN